MLRTLAIISNQIVLSFGVFDSFLITKAIQDWGEFFRIHGKAIRSSFTWKTQALELYSPLPKANQECKEEKQREEFNMKKSKRTASVGHISSSSWSPCILYVISKLGKSEVQRFKWYANQSWNEEVMAIRSKSHQVERQFRKLRNQPFCAKWRLWACQISQPMLHATKSTWVIPEICDRLF